MLANAGIAPIGDGDRGPSDVWQDVIDVNLTGVWNTVEVAVPPMVERGHGGAIVLTSSTAGLKGIGGDSAAGSATPPRKHGVVGLMRALRDRAWPRTTSGSTSVHPTGVNTPMVVNEAMQVPGERDRVE